MLENIVAISATNIVFIVSFIKEWSLNSVSYHFSENPVHFPP